MSQLWGWQASPWWCHIGVDDVSLSSIFNKDLFQGPISRAHFSRTQVVNDEQATFATDKYINMLLYLFRKATEELMGNHSAKVLKKIGVEVDGVILSEGKNMQGMEFLETAEVDVDLRAMGIRTSLPVMDRHSPL